MSLCTVVLSLLLPSAHAADGATHLRLDVGGKDALFAFEAAASAESFTAELSSDAGSEDVVLVEADTRLHGSANLASLPASESRLKLNLYDTSSGLLIAFVGTLGADGTVRLDVDGASASDIELLAAGAVSATTGGYDVRVDLSGADAGDVAYGELAVEEVRTVTSCEKGGGCTTTTTTVVTTAEIGWDGLEAVWAGEPVLAHTGELSLKVHSRDAGGRKLATHKARLAAPWADGETGIGAISTDDDPLTSVALARVGTWDTPMEVPYAGTPVFNVVSEGWSLDSPLPVSATIELDGGETWTVPVNSYQVSSDGGGFTVADAATLGAVRLRIDGGTLAPDGVSTLVLEDLLQPLCTAGTCVSLVETPLGTYELAVTAYAASAEALDTDVEIELAYLDAEGIEVQTESIYPHFQDDFKAMFALEVGFAGDPLGSHLEGKVTLYGEADSRGKQKSLSKGRFYARVVRGDDGELTLAGADKDEVVSDGSLWLGQGTLDLSDSDGNGVANAPPVVALAPVTGGPDASEKHGDILIDGVPIDYD